MTGSRARLRDACADARAAGSTVGLVPTMGALHLGHRSLLARAREQCGFVAMTLFVNPMQFGPDEDFEHYPVSRENDLAGAERAGCDVVFAPNEAEMFANAPPEITVDPGPLGERLEGASRPGHFRGMLTVVSKLFDLAGSCRAFFGEKDAQQLELVRRMVACLDMPVEVAACPTVRDAEGLALSSRNANLSLDERRAALSLVRSLVIAGRLAREGERRADVLRAEMARRIGAEPLARLDYVAAVDDRTWEDVAEVRERVRLLVAATFARTRLIDNLLLEAPNEAPDRAE